MVNTIKKGQFLIIFLSLLIGLSSLVCGDVFHYSNGALLSDTVIEPGADFSGQFLEGGNFNSGNLRNSSFVNSDLQYSSFYQADLGNADLRSANLGNVYFGFMSLTNADFTGAIIDGTQFREVTGFTFNQLESTASYQSGTLKSLSFDSVNFSNRSFASMNILNGYIVDSTLTNVDFSRSNLTSTSIWHTDLSGADFSNANLRNSGIWGCDLTGANFSGAIITMSALPGAVQYGMTSEMLYSTASYQNKELRGVNLSQNDFSSWDFSGQDLSDGSFELSDLTGTDFTGANLTNNNLFRADFTDAIFTDAIIEGTCLYNYEADRAMTAEQLYSTKSYKDGQLDRIQLYSTNISNWDFSNQSLKGAYFSNATVHGANFSGSDLSGASFLDSSLVNVNLNNAIVSGANLTRTKVSKDQLMSTRSFQERNFQGVHLSEIDLTGFDFSHMNLGSANFLGATLAGADFTDALIDYASFSVTTRNGFTKEQLYSTDNYKRSDLQGVNLSSNNLSGWNFAGQNLSSVKFSSSALAGADFTDAVINGVDFRYTIRQGFTQDQLQSTRSYQQGNLQNIRLGGNDLTDWDFSQQDLSGVSFEEANLSGVNFTGAIINGTDFTWTAWAPWDYQEGSGFMKEQLYSTKSFQDRDLRGVIFGDEENYMGNYFNGWDFSHQNLSESSFQNVTLYNSDFTCANLIGSNFDYVMIEEGNTFYGTDCRGSLAYFRGYSGNDFRNLINYKGEIVGLAVNDGEVMRLWDFNGYGPYETIPIKVYESMSVDAGGTLKMVFEDDQWGSTIGFIPGIDVTLAGTLELVLDEALLTPEKLAELMGTIYQIFDWTGANRVGEFDLIVCPDGVEFDTSMLYTTGEVMIVPEPVTIGLFALGGIILLRKKRLN